jgi:hypothetical protein
MAILSRSLRTDDVKCDSWGRIIEKTCSPAVRTNQAAPPRATTEIVIRDEEENKEDEGYITFEESMHRDGSIYRGMARCAWRRDFRIGDRSETRLEATMRSDPTPNCTFHRDDGTCWRHHPTKGMLQFFSFEVAKLPPNAAGSVELYGYVATRDDLDPSLNYVVNISRDDPIVVKQGSLIDMAGPKRGIEMDDCTVVEYDMRIKNSAQEKDDLQLIDGALVLEFYSTSRRPFTLD